MDIAGGTLSASGHNGSSLDTSSTSSGTDFRTDAMGNVAVYTGTLNFSFNDANQISTSGYGYDKNGNMTGYGGGTFTYDAWNHIVKVTGGFGVNERGELTRLRAPRFDPPTGRDRISGLPPHGGPGAADGAVDGHSPSSQTTRLDSSRRQTHGTFPQHDSQDASLGGAAGIREAAAPDRRRCVRRLPHQPFRTAQTLGARLQEEIRAQGFTGSVYSSVLMDGGRFARRMGGSWWRCGGLVCEAAERAKTKAERKPPAWRTARVPAYLFAVVLILLGIAAHFAVVRPLQIRLSTAEQTITALNETVNRNAEIANLNSARLTRDLTSLTSTVNRNAEVENHRADAIAHDLAETDRLAKNANRFAHSHNGL